MTKVLSKKWRQWIGCQGWFDDEGYLRLSYAKIYSHDMSNNSPCPWLIGEDDTKNMFISFRPGEISLFPKKFIILPK